MCAMVDTVIPRLIKMVDNTLPNLNISGGKSYALVMGCYSDLSIDLRKSYIEMKSEPIIYAIEQSMRGEGIDWNTSLDPTSKN